MINGPVKYCFLHFSILFFLNSAAFAQKLKWTGSETDRNVFIENKGQFDGKDDLQNSKIVFAYVQDGLEIYFTLFRRNTKGL